MNIHFEELLREDLIDMLPNELIRQCLGFHLVCLSRERNQNGNKKVVNCRIGM